MSLTFIDFFAGIGGMRLGLEQAGHKCIGFCEFDKFAVTSYRAMHNTEGEWYSNDVRDIRATDIPRADLWTAGFPCQDISIAGKQLGFDGKRSSLFFAVTRLIRDLEEKDRPDTLLFENVKNLLSVNGGVDFLKLQIELAEIGYDAEWQVLNSKDYGVPQNRERVFVVGHIRGRGGREIFPLRKYSQPLADIQGQQPTTNTIIARYYGGQATGSYVVESQQYAQKIKCIGNLMPSGNKNNSVPGRVYDVSGISPCLRTPTGGKAIPLIVTVLDIYNHKLRTDGLCGTITAGENTSALRCGSFGIVEGDRIRRLTPKECWRLQGFPDVYFERAKAVNSDRQLYKQAGNAVTVNVAYIIGQALSEVSHD